MSDDNIIRVPRIVRTGPLSALSIRPADETGVATTTFHSLARPTLLETIAEVITLHKGVHEVPG